MHQQLDTMSANFHALQLDVSFEIHDRHTELIKIVATNRGGLGEKVVAGQSSPTSRPY